MLIFDEWSQSKSFLRDVPLLIFSSYEISLSHHVAGHIADECSHSKSCLCNVPSIVVILRDSNGLSSLHIPDLVAECSHSKSYVSLFFCVCVALNFRVAAMLSCVPNDI